MTEETTGSGEPRVSSTGPISVSGMDSAAVADAKDAAASNSPAGPVAPDAADEPQPRRRLWREFRAWAHGIAVRLDKPPRQIFANGRIYNRIRISTVALMVAFLAVLWVYQDNRTPTADPATTSDQQTDKAPASKSAEPSPNPVPATPSATTEGTPTPTPTSTPTGTETTVESSTEGEPTPSTGSDRTAPATSRAETTPTEPAPTSQQPSGQ